MWEEIFRAALQNGLWAVLFCALLLYQLKDGRTRESKYRQTIDVLLDRLRTLGNVEKGVEDVLTLLRRRDKRKAEAKETPMPKSGTETEACGV